jgi:hypothetical protein
MLEIRNLEHRLVCRLNETTGTVEILVKGCLTRIKRLPNGKIIIIHTKPDPAT